MALEIDCPVFVQNGFEREHMLGKLEKETLHFLQLVHCDTAGTAAAGTGTGTAPPSTLELVVRHKFDYQGFDHIFWTHVN